MKTQFSPWPVEDLMRGEVPTGAEVTLTANPLFTAVLPGVPTFCCC